MYEDTRKHYALFVCPSPQPPNEMKRNGKIKHANYDYVSIYFIWEQNQVQDAIRMRYEQASDQILRPKNGLFGRFCDLVAFCVVRMNIIVIICYDNWNPSTDTHEFCIQYIVFILKTYRRRAVMLAVCGKMCWCRDYKLTKQFTYIFVCIYLQVNTDHWTFISLT